jgi:hypothetical protein
LYPVTEEEEKQKQIIQKRKIKVVGTPKPFHLEKFRHSSQEDVEISKDEVYTEEPRIDPYSCTTTLNNS